MRAQPRFDAGFAPLRFPLSRVFNNFSALFSGLFLAIYVVFPFIFSNFSALFFQKRIFMSHLSQKIAAGRHWRKTTMLGQKSQAKSSATLLGGCERGIIRRVGWVFDQRSEDDEPETSAFSIAGDSARLRYCDRGPNSKN